MSNELNEKYKRMEFEQRKKDSIVKKWEKTLLLEGLSENAKLNLAMILDNQANELRKNILGSGT